MGKCEFSITKGKKKGQICGQYSKLQLNNKYYCGVHLQKINENESNTRENITKDEANERKKKKDIFKVDFNNDYESENDIDDLEVMINNSYKNKNIQSYKGESTNDDHIVPIKNCLHNIMERLEIVENKLTDINNKKNYVPDIEEFKI